MDLFIMFYVYQYSDPRDGIPFYIGKGIRNRDMSHLRSAQLNRLRQTHCSKKCEELLSEGVTPLIIRCAENLSEDEAHSIEKELISKYGRLGFEPNGTLVNKSTGGKSNTGYHHTEETRKKLSEIRTGNTHHSAESRTRISQQTLKALQDPEIRHKISEAHKGKKKAAEHREKLSAHLTSLNKDPDMNARKLQSRINNGTLNHSEETKDKISARTSEAMNNPNVIQRMKESAKKRWENPEERGKIAAKKSKTFRLTNRETSESFTISNLAKYCRDNKTYERKVHKEFIVEKIN